MSRKKKAACKPSKTTLEQEFEQTQRLAHSFLQSAFRGEEPSQNTAILAKVAVSLLVKTQSVEQVDEKGISARELEDIYKKSRNKTLDSRTRLLEPPAQH